MIEPETLALFEQYPGVLAFAEAMMYKIDKNKVDPPGKPNPWPKGPDGKSRMWDKEYVPLPFLYSKLQEERREFDDELAEHYVRHDRPKSSITDINLLMEAADEANLLMMICDNRGVLKY